MANVVPLKNPIGVIRLYTNFRDLNKACSKDDFPLPNIDMIIDSLIGYEMLSFMDGFLGYNQIKIKESDKHKKKFRTWGNFCYKVMPFGLKNVGATYEREMIAMFHDFIHKIVEVYIDDILIKSKSKEDHVKDVKIAFERMKQYKLRIKAQKCVYGVSSRKLLGHIVSRRGVEVDSKNIKAIIEMYPPMNLKQLRILQGKIQYVRRFICQLTNKIVPMSHLLKKEVEFKWNMKCQEAFNKIKEYLLHPLVLAPKRHGEPLWIYVSTTEHAFGVMLVKKEEDGKERVVYFISRTLKEYETRYTPIEKLCQCIVFAIERLRYYMINSITHVLTQAYPLRYLMSKSCLNGRSAKWIMLL